MKCFITSLNSEAIPSDMVKHIHTLANIQGISDNGGLLIVEVPSENLIKLEEYCSMNELELKKTAGFSF